MHLENMCTPLEYSFAILLVDDTAAQLVTLTGAGEGRRDENTFFIRQYGVGGGGKVSCNELLSLWLCT
jgi:hypothetical protein